jgi:hypothetical protein
MVGSDVSHDVNNNSTNDARPESLNRIACCLQQKQKADPLPQASRNLQQRLDIPGLTQEHKP